MKKLLLAAFLCAGIYHNAAAQADPAVNITVLPGSVERGSDAVLNVNFSNLGTVDVIATNSLEIRVNAGTNAQILALNASSDSRWTVVSSSTGTNNTYTLRNTAGGLGAIDEGDLLLDISGAVVSSGIISASIGYASGSNLPGGASNASQGNSDITNDTSVTTFSVTVPLPVQLLAFSGTAKACDAVLNWQLAGEDAMDYYELQGSTDARNFKSLRTLKSQNEKSIRDYSVQVAQQASKTYYRLKMVGINGEVEWSHTVAVVTTCADKSVAVFPNPTRGSVTVTGIEAGTVLNVHNVMGQQVAHVVSAGSTTKLQLQDLPAGQYTITFAGAENAHPIRLTKTD